jgi:hypothetical protein
MPDGWDFDPTAIVPRRTTPLFVGAIVFVKTDDRVYRRRWNGRYYVAHGGPVARYYFKPRKIVGETRVSWLIVGESWQSRHQSDKVPKRDLSSIYGRDDVEDVLWIGANQFKIAEVVRDWRESDPAKARWRLEAIAQIMGVETK